MRRIIVLAAVMLSLTASGGLFAKDRDRLFCSTGYAPIDTLDMFRLDIFTLSHEDSVALLARLHEQDSIVRFLDSVNRIYPSYEFYKESWDMARINPQPRHILFRYARRTFPLRCGHRREIW